ncbi:putative cytoplasmic protein [Pseudomonas syringae pv. actinidiae]|nr:putative cytoplasmic protein [Pseudomonas syringae pv. actinidiae]
MLRFCHHRIWQGRTMLNNIRFDLSDYLIHFFRDVDQSGSEPILFPEHARFNNIAEATVLDSLFLMRCALRHNKIFATWSFRNERPTIYGRSPAVCFTDMPLAAFVQSSNERLARGENVGRYAFMIPKAAMFSVGARPVIYGLSQPATERRDALPNRVFDNDVLPIGDERTTDWTHEREWRWRYQDEESHSMPAGEDFDDTLAQMPGLSLGDSGIHGMGVLVQDQDDVPKIVYDVLTMVDAGIINQSMIRFVIPLCKVEQHGNIQDPSRVSDLIKEHTIDLSGYFSITEERVEEINNEVDSIIRAITTSGGHEPGDRDDGYGKSWVWIPDNGSELARAMLAANRLIVSTEGRYLLDIAPFESLPVGFEEHYCKRVAQGLATEFEVNATYFTVRDSLSCDGVPYYTDFHDKHHPFYNSTKGCY